MSEPREFPGPVETVPGADTPGQSAAVPAPSANPQPPGPPAVPPSFPAAAPRPKPPDDDKPAHAAPGPLADRRVRVIMAWIAAGAIAILILTAYLFASAQAWEQRADEYLEVSLELGDDLAATRADLTGTRAELEAVRNQLTAAQERIVELANEKAQLGDEWEITQQLVDYQERVTEAAGGVALALDECVRGQDQLISYLEHPELYDENDLDAFAQEVQTFCQQATEANLQLQQELAR